MDGVTAEGLLLTLITNDVRLAASAAAAGVGRVLVDLERRGKARRQKGRGYFLSNHTWADVAAVRRALPPGALIVRLDPLHERTRDQVERSLWLGADALMLPYFRSADAVFRLGDLVAGRCTIVPLVETMSAVRQLPAILASGCASEFHLGLNDLALDLGRASLTELWGGPLLDEIAGLARHAGAAFGIGGVCDPRTAGLPVDPAWVIAEQRRLGSSRALLGRSFRAPFEHEPDPTRLAAAVQAIQSAYRAAPGPRNL